MNLLLELDPDSSCEDVLVVITITCANGQSILQNGPLLILRHRPKAFNECYIFAPWALIAAASNHEASIVSYIFSQEFKTLYRGSYAMWALRGFTVPGYVGRIVYRGLISDIELGRILVKVVLLVFTSHHIPP